MTARIRWESTKYGGFTGRAGTLEPFLFQIWKTGSGRWQLDSMLPGQFGWHLYSDDAPDALKQGAEAWLEEFVTSLGTVFPDPATTTGTTATAAGEE